MSYNDHLERVSAEVKASPVWKRGGIGVANPARLPSTQGHHCPDADWRYITKLDGEYVNCLCRERLENARQQNLFDGEEGSE